MLFVRWRLATVTATSTYTTAAAAASTYCYGYNGYSLVQHSAVAANHRGLQLGPDHHQSATSAQNGGQTTRAPLRNMAAWTWGHPPLVAPT